MEIINIGNYERQQLSRQAISKFILFLLDLNSRYLFIDFDKTEIIKETFKLKQEMLSLQI